MVCSPVHRLLSGAAGRGQAGRQWRIAAMSADPLRPCRPRA